MKLCLVALLSLYCCAAAAGIGQGMVAKVESGPLYGSKVFITIDGVVTDSPACRTAGNYHFVFDASSPEGKAVMATIMLAKATKQSVIVSGFERCSLYGGVEDLRWFRLE